MASKESYRTELRSAARQLGDRCLYSAAKWYLFHKPSLHLSKPSTQTLIFFFYRAAELLVSLEPDPSSASSTPPLSSLSSRNLPSASTSSHSFSAPYGRHSDGSSLRRRIRAGGAAPDASATPVGGISYVSTPMPVEDGSEGDNDVYLLAKAYFDCREFRRAAHVLCKQTGRKAVFLRCYALYLVLFLALNKCYSGLYL